jgi:hypothetical protein
MEEAYQFIAFRPLASHLLERCCTLLLGIFTSFVQLFMLLGIGAGWGRGVSNIFTVIAAETWLKQKGQP